VDCGLIATTKNKAASIKSFNIRVVLEWLNAGLLFS
jgi:hypothetical protein